LHILVIERLSEYNLSINLNSAKSCEITSSWYFSQVAIKNNIDVLYFATLVPIQVLFTEDGLMERKVYLSTWKDIPAQNEAQISVSGVTMSLGECSEVQLFFAEVSL